MNNSTIDKYTAAGGADITSEVVAGGGEDGRKSRALAHSNTRLLRLVAPENMLEPMQPKECLNGPFPEARAATGRKAEAAGVQGAVLLLGRGRI